MIKLSPDEAATMSAALRKSVDVVHDPRDEAAPEVQERIIELEAENEQLRSLLRDDRDCWARNDELEARNAKLKAALRRIRDEGRKDTTWLARFIVDESGKALEESE